MKYCLIRSEYGFNVFTSILNSLLPLYASSKEKSIGCDIPKCYGSIQIHVVLIWCPLSIQCMGFHEYLIFSHKFMAGENYIPPIHRLRHLFLPTGIIYFITLSNIPLCSLQNGSVRNFCSL